MCVTKVEARFATDCNLSRQQAWLKRMRVQRATAAEAQRGPLKPELGFCGLASAQRSLWLAQCPGSLSRRSAVLCRGSLDRLPCSAGRRRHSVTCPIKAASLPFPNEHGNRERSVRGINNLYICITSTPSLGSPDTGLVFEKGAWPLLIWHVRELECVWAVGVFGRRLASDQSVPT